MNRRARVSLWLAVILLTTASVLLWLSNLQPSRLLSRLWTRQDATWAAMQSRGTWRVGMDPSFPPFQSLNDAGQPVGYDVDLAHALAAQWGLTAEIVPIGFDSLVDALIAGRVDSVVSALPYDPRLTRDVTYSAPYFEAGVRLAVRADSPITGTAGLTGAQVAVEWGSMGDMVGRRLQRAGGALTLRPAATPDEAVAALVNDPSVDALLIDQVSLRQAQGAGAAIVAIGPALESNPYVIAMPMRAYDLHTQVADTLSRLRADGAFDALEERWFGPQRAP